MPKGFIYIMTNPCLKDMVKIGYATDVEARRKQLSTTALPYEYEIYATYETNGHLEDKQLHKLIDKLNPDLRVTKNREFFVMSPHDAYDLLESIAIITGSENKLILIKKPETKINRVEKRPPIDFVKCGIPIGATLVYTEDPSVKVTVVDNRHISYTNEITSLSGLAQSFQNKKAVQGSLYFTYNGEKIIDIAERTQWKND